MRALVLALLLTLLPGGVAVAACRDIQFENAPYTICEARAGDDLRLFLNGPSGPYGGFSALNETLSSQGEKLAFAMNAGMFQPDLSPVGLFIENGETLSPIVTSDGPGNFGLLPNGVFCVGAAFQIVESRRFAKLQPACTYASQSGPMLVIDGKLHPLFKPGSDSLHIRNGVGVSADGKTAFFAISNTAVNFAAFARLFRDALGTPDALYLDGSVSRLYAPDLGRAGSGFAIGPIVGLVLPKGSN